MGDSVVLVMALPLCLQPKICMMNRKRSRLGKHRIPRGRYRKAGFCSASLTELGVFALALDCPSMLLAGIIPVCYASELANARANYTGGDSLFSDRMLTLKRCRAAAGTYGFAI